MKEKIRKGFEVITDRRTIASLFIFYLLYVKNIFINILNNPSARVLYQKLGWVLAFFVAFDMLAELFSRKLILSKQQIPIWIFFCWAFICTFFNPNEFVQESVRQLAIFLMECYLLITMKKRIGQKKTDKYLAFIGYQVIIVFLVVNLINLYLFVHYKIGGSELSGIFASEKLFVYNNGLHGEQYKGIYEWMTDGSYRCLLSLLVGFILADKKKLPWWAAGINATVCAVMLFLEGCRSSLIGLCVTFVYLIWYIVKKVLFHFSGFKPKYRKVQIFMGILLLGVLILAFVGFRKLSTLQAADQAAFYDTIQAVSTGRWKIWQAAIKLANESPIFGWGWGSFPQEGLKFLYSDIMTVDYHNIFINVLVFTGYPGLVLFLVLLFTFYFLIIKNVKYITVQKNCWMFILCICFLISSCLNTGVLGQDSHIEDPFFWICLGCLIYPKPSRKNESQDKTAIGN